METKRKWTEENRRVAVCCAWLQFHGADFGEIGRYGMPAPEIAEQLICEKWDAQN